MDEPEPLPAFTFSPDGPPTITYPDGTVSVNAPRPGDPAVIPAAAADEPMTATSAAAAPGSVFPPEAPDDFQPEVRAADPEPRGDSAIPGISTPAADVGAPGGVPGVSDAQTWGFASGVPGAAESQASGSPAASADAVARDPVVNPDGSITTRLPDGSTQTVVRLPGGATIVTSTTRPGQEPRYLLRSRSYLLRSRSYLLRSRSDRAAGGDAASKGSAARGNLSLPRGQVLGDAITGSRSAQQCDGYAADERRAILGGTMKF